MRQIALVCLFLAFSIATANAASDSSVQPVDNDYKLGVGDVVRIEVHDEPDLAIETQIPTTGAINYPFLGLIKAAGLTVAQFQSAITQGLKGDYLVKPDVRIRVTLYRNFYVRGQVRNSGGFSYVPGLTVEKAATLAGGFTDRASMSKLFLVHENTSQDKKIKVGLDSPILPGDTLIVEESLF